MTSVTEQFSKFRAELDAKHDKYEAIVKISRDITVESKRTIFLLHRVDILNTDPHSREGVIGEVEIKVSSLSKKWYNLATELKNTDPRMFLRAYSPGLQEYIEAMALLHYLRSESKFKIESIRQCLIPLHVIKSHLSFMCENSSDSMAVSIPPVEFLLGIADTTGEIMRLCINAAAKATSPSSKNQVFKLCAFIRVLYEMFTTFPTIVNDPYARKNLHAKLDVMRSSLQKVEECCYQLGIRDSEFLDYALRQPSNSEE